MKSRIRLLVSLLLVLAPCLLPAATHTVTTGSDHFQNAPEGSLRRILDTVAQPGDTVKLGSLVITQVDSMVVRASLVGLRIEGPGELRFKRVGNFRRGVLRVDASGVTLENVRFRAIHVDFGGFFNPVLTGIAVKNCLLIDQGSIHLTRTAGALIESNTFTLGRNLDEEAAIGIAESTDTVIANNTITLRQLPGLQANSVSNLEVRDNTANAPFSIELSSGRVLRNTIDRRSLNVYQSSQDGPILVEDNTCAMLRVTGVDLSVRRNTVEGNRLLKTDYGTPVNARVDLDATPLTSLGVYVGLLVGQSAHDGPVFIENNIITGGKTGLAVSQRVTTPETTVLNNTIHRASLKGISLSITVPARVAGNVISECTGRARGPRAALAVTEGTEDLLIENNQLTGNRCNGIVISGGATALVKGNTVTGGSMRGIVVAQDGEIVAENNTIDRCKTAGIYLDPSSEATLTSNTITRTAGPGVLVSKGAVLTATGLTVEENVGPGIRFQALSKGTVTGGSVKRNRGAGVYLLTAAEADLRGVAFGGNTGPGIDIFPPGITPNLTLKRANGGIDFPEDLEFDSPTRRIRGKAEVGALVQLFRSEAGARTGKRRNGEGAVLVGEASVDGNGEFSIAPGPAQEGDLFCLTATRLGAQPVTSEFSENVEVPPTSAIERVTVSSDGQEANGNSVPEVTPLPNLSDNGRLVAFTSSATNLVNDDTNEGLDVFVRDVTNGTTERVSVDSDEQQTTGDGVAPFSASASISADGRWVAFRSSATNLLPGPPAGQGSGNFSFGFIALRDRVQGTTTGVTDPSYVDVTRPSGSRRRGHGTHPSISADGNVVAFISDDGAFVPEDTNVGNDIFVWTRGTGAYERISVSTAGQQFSGSASYQDPRLSGDGMHVAFSSAAALVPGNSVAGFMVFLRDRTTNVNHPAKTTELISMNAAGDAVPGHSPSISRDGRFVAFATSASLVPDDVNSTDDIYVRDRQEGLLQFCSRTPDGLVFPGNCKSPAISGDGRYVAFCGPGKSVDGGFTLLHDDLFVFDRVTGVTIEAGIGISGEANGVCSVPNLSHDGRFMTFKSAASNLVENDTNFLSDLFVRDRSAELTD